VVPALSAIHEHNAIHESYWMRGLPVEGKAVASEVALLFLLSMFVLVIGFILALTAYRRLPSPRTRARKIELAAFALPLLAWLLFGYPLFVWVRGP
jgi:hypothetical protein